MTEKTTGTQIVREAVWARRTRLTVMARDAGIDTGLLEAFAQGRAELRVEVIQYLVSKIWGDFTLFDADADALCSVPPPPARTLGRPPQLTMTLPKFTLGPNQRGGPQPEVKEPPKPKTKPGWIGVW